MLQRTELLSASVRRRFFGDMLSTNESAYKYKTPVNSTESIWINLLEAYRSVQRIHAKTQLKFHIIIAITSTDF